MPRIGRRRCVGELGEVEASLFCDNEFPIVPSELDGFTCRYNGTPITEPTFIESNVQANQSKIWSAGPSSDKTLPLGWIVQVTSTQTSTRAKEISQSLKALSLKSYINEAQVDGTVMYNIIVGPKLNKRRALADKELIDNSLGITSKVIPLNLYDM